MLMFIKILFITFYLASITKCSSKDYCSVDFCNNSQQHTLCKYPSEKPASTCLSYERTIINDTDKRLILDKINSRRNKVAAGEIRSLPTAAGMMKLEWNIELEKSAQRWADQCVKHGVDLQDTCRDLGDMPVGQNVATVQGDSPGLTPLALVDVWYMELLKINSSVISRYVPSSDFNEQHYDYFTQLVWEESTEVGCGGVKFKERLDVVKYRTIYRLVCNFAPAGNRRNKAVYSCGSPCSACPDGVCDNNYKALCEHKTNTNYEHPEKDTYDEAHPTHSDTLLEFTTRSTVAMADQILDAITLSDMHSENVSKFNNFPHLQDSKVTRERITYAYFTKEATRDDVLLNDFIELLKKKLNSDSLIKNLLLTTTQESNGLSDASFSDEGVAAFINKVYSKKVHSTTLKTTPKDLVNSTLLVDLIEAVIFRSNGINKISSTEMYQQNPQTLPIVKPVKVQAELAEVQQNKEFTGHYFFPEEDDESSRETTESYYDSMSLAQTDVEMEIEYLKMSSITRDFLDDIFETEISTEKIKNVNNSIIYANDTEKIYSQSMKRGQRDARLSGGYFRDIDCTYRSDKLPNGFSTGCYKSDSKKYLSYKILLKKIAKDLSKLKLNALFHCTSNSSQMFFKSMSLFVCVMCMIIYLILKQ